MFVRVLRVLPRLVSKVARRNLPHFWSTCPLLLHASVLCVRPVIALNILRR
jgi:hypothetical protein